jgi:hypothetical protein
MTISEEAPQCMLAAPQYAVTEMLGGVYHPAPQQHRRQGGEPPRSDRPFLAGECPPVAATVDFFWGKNPPTLPGDIGQHHLHTL